MISALVRLRATYVDLTTAVRAGAVLQDAGARVTVRASVETSAYTYRREGAAPLPRRGSVRTVRLHLQWTGSGWRIASVG